MAATTTEAAIRRSIARIAAKGTHDLKQTDLDRLVGWLEYPNPEIRSAAMDALRPFSVDWDLVDVVLPFLASEPDPEARATAIRTLAFLGIGYQEDADAAAEYEGREPNYAEDTPEEYDTVREALQARAGDTQEAEPARVAAIVGLGELADDPRARAAVLPYLEAPESPLRAAALKAIGYSGNPEGVEEKLLAALNEADYQIRSQAILACGMTRLGEAAERIRTFADSPDPVIRAAAWLGFAGCAPLDEVESFLRELGETLTEADPLYPGYREARGEMEERMAEEEEADLEDILSAWEEAEEEKLLREREARVAAFAEAERGDDAGDADLAEAEFTAGNFLEFLFEYLGQTVSSIDRGVVREYLLGFYPRKVSMPPALEAHAPEALARFLRYLACAGELPEGNELARYAGGLKRQFREAVEDPRNWGLAKALMMQAINEGVDPTDAEAMQAFVERFNERVAKGR